MYIDMSRQYKSMQTQMEMRIQFLEEEVKRLTSLLGGYAYRMWSFVRYSFSEIDCSAFVYCTQYRSLQLLRYCNSVYIRMYLGFELHMYIHTRSTYYCID